jgi:hydrogenase nickel incorporation protein HypB
MCNDCGCGLPGEKPVGYHAHSHGEKQQHSHEEEHHHGEGEPHSHEHEHDHHHDHEHGPGHHHGEPHTHSHSHAHGHTHSHGLPDLTLASGSQETARRTLELREAILAKNDRLAERNRGFFRGRGLLVLNFLSSPGSGKTTFLRETVRLLQPDLKAGVIVGDLATDNDAVKLRESGAPVVQITTGTVCHLEADMVGRAVSQINLDGLGLLLIENVGNLVCPASYDLGEDLRVVLLSVTEGEDKPLKYPPMFQAAKVVIVSKIDLAQACDYDRAKASANLRRIAPEAHVFELSAKTGQGMDAWREFLLKSYRDQKGRSPLLDR